MSVAARAAKLAEAGFSTVADVLLHLPFRYEDRRRFARIEELVPGEAATLFVRVASARGTRMRRGSLRIEALADDGSEAIRVVWHNRYPSFLKAAQSGHSAVLYGAPVVTAKGELRLENPETEFFEPGEETDPQHSGKIIPITRRVADVPPRAWRAMTLRAIEALSPEFESATVPAREIHEALRAVHFPREMEEAARRARSWPARN